jgi:hypothetical protein
MLFLPGKSFNYFLQTLGLIRHDDHDLEPSLVVLN